MVVFGPYGLRWVRARYTTGRTVVIGSVHSSLWDIRWSVGPYAVVLWAYGVYWAFTPDSESGELVYVSSKCDYTHF